MRDLVVGTGEEGQGSMRQVVLCFGAMSLTVASTQLQAAETQTLTYDALGRLTKVERGGSVNNGVQMSYQFDVAGNRQVLTVAGSQGRQPVQIIVLPLRGYFVMALPDPLAN